MRVLVVEDEIRIREGMEKLLSKFEDIELVGEAEDGQSGIELIRQLRPDVVITDIMMPNKDGLQMLTEMVDEQIPTKAIVLSAYSEFEYARRAMKLGVDEYLLKPISYNDFAKAIENTRAQILRERSQKPDEIGTLEQTLYAILNDRQELSDDVKTYLQRSYGIAPQETVSVMYAYLGRHYDTDKDSDKSQIVHMLSLYKNLKYCSVEDQFRKSVIFILYQYKDGADLERFVQNQILNPMKTREVSIGWVVAEDISHLKEAVDNLLPYMDWSISLGREVLLSYPKITHVQTTSCIYPIDKEAELKKAIYGSDSEAMKRAADGFEKAFANGSIYAPKEIKECYVRFLWAVIGVAKEMGYLDKKDLEQQKLLSMIMDAKTNDELSAAVTMLLDFLAKSDDEDGVVHLTVKRVKSIIHEFYTTGITLDEIADRLDMTPEYVGTLFHREVGTTFSNYIKNLRMNKAKELLCTTSLKLYEIAEQVGYLDPKYFSRVFKETTGMLPGDYRKAHK